MLNKIAMAKRQTQRCLLWGCSSIKKNACCVSRAVVGANPTSPSFHLASNIYHLLLRSGSGFNNAIAAKLFLLHCPGAVAQSRRVSAS